MDFLRLLARVELRAFVAVLVVGGTASAYVFLSALVGPQAMLPPIDWAKLAFLYAVAFGMPVAALLGAPVYAILRLRGHASWPAVCAIGLLPGVAILVFGEDASDLGAWFMGCGVAVAGLTHLMFNAAIPGRPRHRREGNAL